MTPEDRKNTSFPLLSLPPEVLTLIIGYVTNKQDRSSCRLSCQRLCAAVDTPLVWRNRRLHLHSVKLYTKRTWRTLRKRRPQTVTLSIQNHTAQGILAALLKELSTVNSISAPCSVFHAFYVDSSVKKKHSIRAGLKRVDLTLDTYHFNSPHCHCVSALQSFKEIQEINLVVRVPQEEALTFEFFMRLSEHLKALKSIHMLHLPLPPPDLVQNFSYRLGTSRVLELLPQLQEVLGEKGIEVSAQER